MILPGSGSGKSLGVAASKSVLRLIGGADLADVVADWTGINRQTIDKVVRDAIARLKANAPSEFRELDGTGDRDRAEHLLVEAFKRADPRLVPAAAIRGPSALAELIEEQTVSELAGRDWTDDQRGYFHALSQTAAGLVCRWYLEDQNARGHATAAALGHLLDDVTGMRKEQREVFTRTQELLAGVDTKVSRLTTPSEFAAHAAAASLAATRNGQRPGPAVTDWDPTNLGVHASITVQSERTLTPFVPREHDAQLRALLRDLLEPNAQSRLLLVIGNSCVGKTRSLYEAVLEALPQWSLITPKTDSDLKSALDNGIPAATVVWLDELQDRLSFAPDSITAASAVHRLLRSTDLGPILFAGTIWPDELALLNARPPAGAPTNAQAIRNLLVDAIAVPVPDIFTDVDLKEAKRSEDRRILTAIATAADATHPKAGLKITQVLAGGAQLLARLYPDPGTPTSGTFSPAARAVLHAAADLRRIGHPNPIPGWALREVAPAYLEPASPRPVTTWLPAAFEEATADATDDDPLTGRHTLDVHTRGVPALTPTWTTDRSGDQVASYSLHDYLAQDHLKRHRHTPTKRELWTTLVAHVDQLHDPRPLAQNAADRGLLTTAIELTRAESNLSPRDGVPVPTKRRLARLLMKRSYPSDHLELEALAAAKIPEAKQWQLTRISLNELRELAENGDRAARDKLAHLLFRTEGSWARQELEERAVHGDRSARQALIQRLRQDADNSALNELRTMAAKGIPSAAAALASVLSRCGDPTSHDELISRAQAGDQYSLHQLARLGDPGALAQIRSLADSGNSKARRRLMEILGTRHDVESLRELRQRADADAPHPRSRVEPHGDPYARQRLAERLRREGDIAAISELRARAEGGDERAQGNLAIFLGQREDPESIDELKQWVHAGVGADALVWAYRRQGYGHIYELEVDASPVLRPSP